VLGKLHALLMTDLSAFLHITFISDQNLAHSSICKSIYLSLLINLPLYFMHPLTDIIKRISVSDIIYDYDSMSPYYSINPLFMNLTSIVATRKGSKSLLACCVPL
jgi:hypothetical protein